MIMKTLSPSPPSRHRGFALVVTLTLMILLTVIAVGLLTLSSVSLRASSQGEAMATARNNARLALMLAIGELQKATGPDQRITAPASLVDQNGTPGVTGVWESWKPDPEGTNDYETRKTTVQTNPAVADGEFVTWLASRHSAAALDPNTPPGLPAPVASSVSLVSDRQSGTVTIRGTHLNPTRVRDRGEMAWTVLDEGSKARIDLPAESKPDDANRRLSRLRAPARPQAESISGDTAGLRLDTATAAKVVSLQQGELKAGRAKLRAHLHDLTPYAASLPVNVAEGGIKADLTRAFEESTLPADLAQRHVYSNSNTRATLTDPRFSMLAAYYQLYKQPVDPLAIAVPRRYTPVNVRTNEPNLAVLDGTLVAPVVTRVSVVFSLVSRLAHSHWVTTIPNAMKDPQRKHMVYLIYTPVVTIYNPYSVPIQFRDFKVTFNNLPVAFKFFRNGVAQSAVHSLLSTFHVSSQGRDTWEDPFSLTTSTTPGSASGSLVTLYPGEARVFGVSHSASAGWGSMTNYLWQNDLDSSKTKNVYSGAGWDYRSGYIVDWLVPSISQPSTDARRKDNGATMGVFGVHPTDRVNVEVVPMIPGASNGRFSVDFQAKVRAPNSSRETETKIGIYEYIYSNQNKLKEVLENGNHTTIGKVTFPFRRERDFTVSELTLPNPEGTTVAQWGSVPKQFAIFTLGSRTASDSLYPGRPGRTSSFVHHVLQMDASRNHPAQLPMEMSLLPITGAGANTVGSIDADDFNRAFYFSGTTRGTGAIHYVSQNLPTSPLLNLADFRHANLASSGHLPLVQHTVGESLAAPIVPPDKTRHSSSFGYEVVDHAWLSNHTLWDGYFFSGLRTSEDARFLFNHQPMTLNPRQTALTPAGTTADEAAKKALATDSWANLAAMIATKGGFNVNSTSKNAWKAVLSSLRGLDLPVLGPITISDPPGDPSKSKEVVKTAENAAFPRLSRPISDKVTTDNSANNQLRWSGFRELTEAEVDKLAEEIVKQVRDRGPFLSLAEFVNRRLGTASDDKAAFGALEAALKAAGINDIPMGPTNREIGEAEAAALGFANPKAAAGNTEDGASAVISQGDLLSAIGASITVRSDTFVIRSYGAARDGNKITARAWCEAVVQRVPAFVDPTDPPEKAQAAALGEGRKVTDLSAVNQAFGRRYEIIGFRWLNADEI
jgi:type II secretory pathway pseudopilin PulG